MGNFDTSQVHREYTIRYRILGSEDDPLSKWMSKKLDDGKRLYFTGRTVHVIETVTHGVFIGMSMCSPVDAFDKKEGKRRARDRAFGAYRRYKYNLETGRPAGYGLDVLYFPGHEFTGRALRSRRMGFARQIGDHFTPTSKLQERSNDHIQEST